MAENYTAAQAAKIIREGEDLAAMQDIGRRFPLFAILSGGDVESLERLLQAIPEHISVRKMESVLKADIVEEDDEEPEEKPAPKKAKAKPKAKPEPEEDDGEEEGYEEMSAKALYDLCKEREIKVVAKKKAPYYIKKLEEADAADDDGDGDDDDWDI